MTTPEPYQIMIDVESMGTGPRAAIVSFGAVAFRPMGVKAELPATIQYDHLYEFPYFYRHIDLQSSVDVGMEIDASTVLWWLKQNELARKAITVGRVFHLKNALYDFSNFLTLTKSLDLAQTIKLWSNGKSFDCTIIEQAYKLCLPGTPVPFKYYDCRDMRTKLDDAPDVPRIKPMIPHHALFDAIAQAQTIQAVFQAIKS